MLEKIGTEGFGAISKPCYQCLQLVKKIKEEKENVVIAEVGIGIGATAVEIMKLLESDDQYYMFSYEKDVLELKSDLRKLDFECKNINGFGNTHKTYDSYVWELAKIYLNVDKKEIFDCTYLDAAHDFLNDSSACCLLKLMTKVGGYIIFDDIDWSYGNSPTQNPIKRPDILNKYTQEQIDACQIEMVVKVFMEGDKSWKYVDEYSSIHRAVYRREK